MTGAPPDDRSAESRHDDAAVEEWMFTCWAGPVGIVSGFRIVDVRTAWYWAALVRPAQPLLHVTDWVVPRRTDPLLVKGDALWAEHTCDAPMEQWSITNETYATAFDDPVEALGRGFGVPTAISWDLEWYATAAARWCPEPVDHRTGAYEQAGVVHGDIAIGGATEPFRLHEAAAHRWHRWGDDLAPVEVPDAFAHTDQRVVFAFPDGTRADWTLTPDGWRSYPIRS